jgi:hypothetical protein
MSQSDISVKFYQFKPKYYGFLYSSLLKEFTSYGDLVLPKWKKDILFLLLQKSLDKEPVTEKGKAEKILYRDLKKMIKENKKKW